MTKIIVVIITFNYIPIPYCGQLKRKLTDEGDKNKF